MAIIEVIDPPGELMYIVISRSGSMASSVSNWAMTSLAEASSIWTPRKMIRSSKSLLYGFISLTPYEVRSTKEGNTYLDCGSLLSSVTLFSLLTRFRVVLAQETGPADGTSEALRTTWSMKPYSLASSAVYQRSRSASFSICSIDWPVWNAVRWNSVFLTYSICPAWVLMS